MSERYCKDIILKDAEGVFLLPRAYKDHKGNIIHNGLISVEDRTKGNGYDQRITDNSTAITNHTSDTSIHVQASDKTKWNNHINDVSETTPTYHLSSDDRELLNSIYEKIYPLHCVYSSVSNTTPTFEGTTGTSLPNSTLGTGASSVTVYNWERTN